MGLSTNYAVLAFEEVEGRIVRGEQLPARTLDGAIRRAQGLNTFKPGAAAVQIMSDESSGVVHNVIILGTFGSVTPDFLQQSVAA